MYVLEHSKFMHVCGDFIKKSSAWTECSFCLEYFVNSSKYVRAARRYEDTRTGPNHVLRPVNVMRTSPNQVFRPIKTFYY